MGQRRAKCETSHLTKCVETIHGALVLESTFIYTICMKCEICGNEYQLRNQHGGRKKTRPTCQSNHCDNLWTYRQRIGYYQKRGRKRYWFEKETMYDVLRKRNQKAKQKQRFGVSREDFIKQRGGKCQNCGSEKFLRIHHIDNQGRRAQNLGQKPNNDPKNLMVVCQSCHLGHHRWGWELKMKT